MSVKTAALAQSHIVSPPLQRRGVIQDKVPKKVKNVWGSYSRDVFLWRDNHLMRPIKTKRQ